jgi:hypothetical protein
MALFEVNLAGGRTLQAASVLVRATYSGVLEGYPCSWVNQRILERIPGEAAEALGDWPVHVVEPPVKTVHRESHRPFGPEQRMPSCWIAAQFDSAPIDEKMHASAAILIWFQEEASPFPEESALSALRDVAWETLARDFEY